MELQRPRVTLFFFDGWLSISSSVLGAAREFHQRGYDVELFYNRPIIDLQPPELPEGIQLREYAPWTRAILRPILDRLRRNRLRRLSRVQADDTVRENNMKVRAVAKGIVEFLEVPQFALYCRRRVRQPDLAIAFDMNSLAAMDWALPRTTPFVYWGLEVTMLAETRDPFTRWMKQHELKRLKDARAVINQGPVRRALLEQDTKAPLENYVAIPNSPSQPMPSDLRTDFYSGRFPIPPDAWVVLHSGFISTSLLSLEIAQTVPSWPDNLVLVFHERQQRDPQEPYLQAVQHAGGDRTFLSLTPVGIDQVDVVYAGADIGLVCYETAELNKTLAWASSGKLPYYLRHAMPIIIVTPECPPLIAEWNCGVWVTEIAGISDALAKIVADYDGYSKRARQAYEALYDFNHAFDGLMKKLGSPG